MCIIYLDKRELLNFEKLCFLNFKIVENNGLRICVWQGNCSVYQILIKNNLFIRIIEKLVYKDMGKYIENIRVGCLKLID